MYVKQRVPLTILLSCVWKIYEFTNRILKNSFDRIECTDQTTIEIQCTNNIQLHLIWTHNLSIGIYSYNCGAFMKELKSTLWCLLMKHCTVLRICNRYNTINKTHDNCLSFLDITMSSYVQCLCISHIWIKYLQKGHYLIIANSARYCLVCLAPLPSFNLFFYYVRYQ